MRLRGSQKILLIIACLLYAGFLFSFARAANVGILVCGIAMGIVFLVLITIGVPNEEQELEMELDAANEEAGHERIHVDSLIDQLAERREDLDLAKSDIKSREEEIADLNKKYENSQSEVEEVKMQKKFLEERILALETSLEEANRRLAVAESDTNLETILPDIKDDPPKVLNIGEAAEQAADDLSDLAKRAGISIRTISTDATLMVKASPTMIDVLFKNIIDNAIKYMSREGTLQITISRIEEELFIVMKDNGEGLAADETEHIFELNFQGTNRISGNGLGLAQARAIVEYYGGMIYARSSRGNGMGIYIHLPSAV